LLLRCGQRNILPYAASYIKISQVLFEISITGVDIILADTVHVRTISVLPHTAERFKVQDGMTLMKNRHSQHTVFVHFCLLSCKGYTILQKVTKQKCYQSHHLQSTKRANQQTEWWELNLN
jgi:hypothetical protein